MVKLRAIVIAVTSMMLVACNNQDRDIEENSRTIYKIFEADSNTIPADGEYMLFYGVEDIEENKEDEEEIKVEDTYITSLEVVNSESYNSEARKYTVIEGTVEFEGKRFLNLQGELESIEDISLYSTDELIRIILKLYNTNESIVYTKVFKEYTEDELQKLAETEEEFVWISLDEQLEGDILYDSLKSEHGEKVKWTIRLSHENGDGTVMIHGCEKYMFVMGSDGISHNIAVDISDIINGEGVDVSSGDIIETEQQ